MKFRSPGIVFLPYIPRINFPVSSRVVVLLKVSVHGYANPFLIYINSCRRIDLVYLTVSFCPREVPQRHKQSHFAMAQRYTPIYNVCEIFCIWRIADDIVPALLKVHFKEVSNLAVTTVNDVIALNLVPMFLQYF